MAGRLKGRAIVPGAAHGRVLATDVPLSFWGGVNLTTGEVIDRRHPLSGEIVAGRVLALPATRGSSTTSQILLEAIRAGIAPAALITTGIDPVLVLGAIVAAELYGRTVPIVVLEPADYARLAGATTAAINPDGTVDLDP